jgi:1,4-dihydroxy-2-naphthoate octaprenyltransferase
VSRLSVWARGARPRTLGASVTPVVIGTAAAGHAEVWRFAAALLVGLGLQVGVNYANDFHDAARGVDTEARLGPPRMTSSGMASPHAVLIASLTAILVAGVAGLALAFATTLWLVPLGAVAMLALWLYSGGPKPYADLGLGEVMVFAFFGVMATAGTAFVQAERVPNAAWWSGAAVGFLAVAILVANNLRDISTDVAAGKRTLAVRFGDRRTRVFHRTCVAAAFATVGIGVLAEITWEGSGLPPPALLALVALPVALGPVREVGTAEGVALIPVLVDTATLQVAFGALLALGLWVAGATAS